jgi:hypothetical protein
MPDSPFFSEDNSANPTETVEIKYYAGTVSITEWPTLLEASWSQLKSDAEFQKALWAEGAAVDALLSLPRCPVDVRQDGQGVSTAEIFIIFQIILWTPQGKALRKGIEETLQRHLSEAIDPRLFERAGSVLVDGCLKWLRRAIADIRWRRGGDAIGEPVGSPDRPNHESKT